jgi:hypothetical protein
MRVFFGHPKAWDDELINMAAQELAASMTAELGKPVIVVPGRDDFQQNIASEGNFNGWCRSITRRTDQYGKRVYFMVVIPKGDGIGKATAQIATDALKAQIPVAEAEWNDDGSITARRVVRIEDEDSENYISGWRVIVADT